MYGEVCEVFLLAASQRVQGSGQEPQAGLAVGHKTLAHLFSVVVALAVPGDAWPAGTMHQQNPCGSSDSVLWSLAPYLPELISSEDQCKVPWQIICIFPLAH